MRKLLSLFAIATLTTASLTGCDNSNDAEPAVLDHGAISLYANDPLGHSLDLESGAYGTAIEGSSVVNTGGDVDYGTYYPDEFTAGIEGSRKAVIIDLGHEDSVAAHYGYQEFHSGGQGFASIVRTTNTDLSITTDPSGSDFQRLTESSALFVTPTNETNHVPVYLKHIYLVRITDPNEPDFELMGKMLVTSHVEGDNVRVQWGRLE